MKHAAAFAALLALAAIPALAQSRTEIAEEIVRQSVSSYLQTTGNCPCPYNRAANNSQCGGRSAYSRPGGASPICYVDDVTDAMIERHLANQ